MSTVKSAKECVLKTSAVNLAQTSNAGDSAKRKDLLSLDYAAGSAALSPSKDGGPNNGGKQTGKTNPQNAPGHPIDDLANIGSQPWWQDELQKMSALEKLRKETARKIAKDTVSGLAGKAGYGPEWSVDNVTYLLYQALRFDEKDNLVIVYFQTEDGHVDYPLLSFMLDFAVDEANSAHIEWIAINVLKIGEALVKASMTLVSVFEYLLKPIELGKGDVLYKTNDEVLAGVIATLAFKQEEKERQARKQARMKDNPLMTPPNQQVDTHANDADRIKLPHR